MTKFELLICKYKKLINDKIVCEFIPTKNKNDCNTDGRELCCWECTLI